jgi:hypothetical protein
MNEHIMNDDEAATPIEVTTPKKKVKPCRICTAMHPEHKPTPHDPSCLHTDTNATDSRKGAR